MKKLIILLAAFMTTLSLVVHGQSVLVGSPADTFIKELLLNHTKTSTCEEKFVPYKALGKFEIRDGLMRKWEEMDAREPGMKHYMMSWQFPGITITSSTTFSYYGPSTWLNRMELSEPSELIKGLKFGDTVSQFSQVLGRPERLLRSEKFKITDRRGAYVTFVVGKNNVISSIVLECIAD